MHLGGRPRRGCAHPAAPAEGAEIKLGARDLVAVVPQPRRLDAPAHRRHPQVEAPAAVAVGARGVGGGRAAALEHVVELRQAGALHQAVGAAPHGERLAMREDEVAALEVAGRRVVRRRGVHEARVRDAHVGVLRRLLARRRNRRRRARHRGAGRGRQPRRRRERARHARRRAAAAAAAAAAQKVAAQTLIPWRRRRHRGQHCRRRFRWRLTPCKIEFKLSF
ncbi:MAG: hypothetical protein CMM37_00140 [Rhodospirillaceae bacterium]|nr:hypothetical protein [Rhodospirillaceae bacterium]